MILHAILSAFFGTAVMTIASETEMMINERQASPTPGKAAMKVLNLLGIKDVDDKTFNIISTWTHWIYGTAWGVIFWLLLLTGMHLFLIGILYLVIVWGAAQVILPLMGVAKPTWEYGGKATGIDLLLHIIYAAATVIAFILIDKAN